MPPPEFSAPRRVPLYISFCIRNRLPPLSLHGNKFAGKRVSCTAAPAHRGGKTATAAQAPRWPPSPSNGRAGLASLALIGLDWGVWSPCFPGQGDVIHPLARSELPATPSWGWSQLLKDHVGGKENGPLSRKRRERMRVTQNGKGPEELTL